LLNPYYYIFIAIQLPSQQEESKCFEPYESQIVFLEFAILSTDSNLSSHVESGSLVSPDESVQSKTKEITYGPIFLLSPGESVQSKTREILVMFTYGSIFLLSKFIAPAPAGIYSLGYSPGATRLEMNENYYPHYLSSKPAIQQFTYQTYNLKQHNV
jgi:hypothetical protein